MISKNICIVFAVMLASLAPMLDAKPGKHHSKISGDYDNNQQNLNQDGSPVRHRVSKRHDHHGARKRRGFTRWEIPQSDYKRFSALRPSAYSLDRPYVIPIFGSPARNRIFFPPQPLSRNVGTPPDNPFMGTQYIPPAQSRMSPNLQNRFLYSGDESVNYWPDNVWRQSAATTTVRPKPTEIVPTRLPKRKGTTITPPLLHESDKVSKNDIDNIFEKSDKVPTTTTTKPSGKESPPSPGNCVWAVISCCSVSSGKVAEECFEQRGCPGPFWGTSPCDSQFARDAINAALGYYKP